MLCKSAKCMSEYVSRYPTLNDKTWNIREESGQISDVFSYCSNPLGSVPPQLQASYRNQESTESQLERKWRSYFGGTVVWFSQLAKVMSIVTKRLYKCIYEVVTATLFLNWTNINLYSSFRSNTWIASLAFTRTHNDLTAGKVEKIENCLFLLNGSTEIIFSLLGNRQT